MKSLTQLNRLNRLAVFVMLAVGFQAGLHAENKPKNTPKTNKTKTISKAKTKTQTQNIPTTQTQNIPDVQSIQNAQNVQNTQSTQNIKALNTIKALVGGTVITAGDVERQLKISMLSSPEFRAQAQNTEIEALRNYVLEGLIQNALLVNGAREQKRRMSNAQIDFEIEKYARERGITVEQYYQNMQDNFGLDKKAYRLEVAKQKLAQDIIALAYDTVVITERDINEYIDNLKKSGQPLPTGTPYTIYTVKRILINSGNGNSSDSVRKTMLQIYNEIRQEQARNLGVLASRYSQEPASAKGGVIELTDDSEPLQVEEMLKMLQIGQYSVPIETSKNWQIIQMLGKRTETDPAKMQREAIRRQLLQEKRTKAQEELLGQLQHMFPVRAF